MSDKKIDIKKTDTIKTHKNAVEELYELDPETQMHELRISNFLLKYPELTGISYASADLIIAEKNTRIFDATIKCIAAEICKRADVDAPGFRFIYRRISENQVRQILRAERIKENPGHKTRKSKNAEITLECPFCGKIYKQNTRDKILSFRTTENVDDAIAHLAEKCGISKSLLISELLFIENHFGSEFR